ncbi:MAG TPA: hypothetical protein VFT22_07185 [Kofleriaceae bacterium]|nr:hypothetical protein [Kofleriaceae bacterium]
MREQLAKVGIVLDEPKVKPAAQKPPAHDAAAGPDRALIREVLIERGAPLEDLEWLSASCPSIEDAIEYTPPGGASCG